MDFLVNKKMKVFVTLMETGCFNLAASRLFITRTPLTRTLSEIEKQLNTNLFIRKQGQLLPTPFAYDLFNKIIPHYRYLDNLDKSIDPNLEKKKVKIIIDDTYPDVMKEMILSLLKQYKLAVSTVIESIDREILSSTTLSANSIIISARNYGIQIEHMQKRTLNKSGVILIMSKEIYNNGMPDTSAISNTPILLRDSAKLFNLSKIYDFFEHQFGVFNPVFDFNNMTFFESLHAMKTGKALLLLPSYICNMLDINKSHGFYINNITISTYAYFAKETENKTKTLKMINEINHMFKS
ncbi:hypothetical protein DOJ06_24070 [Salmonella enterica subsp. enterica serovar Bareilly]|nr:hypothetical protein [Salmonella enterica subsp. enterica serovar Bareilly]